jgi:MEDS: MEthanogen/methylotroph, DcmR Sensory domain/Histidine kinase-like ATPase domain
VVGTGNLDVGHHVVQFYGRDEDLAGSVAAYLLDAVKNEGVAVVIATADHRRAFEERLAEAGIDLAAAAASGAYLALDARETVSEFMAADQPDRADFDRVIGGLIARVCGGGRLVRAYGEMVALLWDDGLVNAAVQLEELWNDLGRRHSFALFCGYPAHAVAREGQVDAFAEVCRLHRQVIGSSPGPATLPGAAAPHGSPGELRTFAFSADAPAAARHFAVGAVRRWGVEDMADDVALVVTELAANAVVHARSGFTLALSVQEELLRISVRDDGPLPSVDNGPALPPTPLHGLGAVDALASRWGVESLGSAGKEVWVELRR